MGVNVAPPRPHGERGGERRAAHGPPIGDGLLPCAHHRHRTTTGHTPCAAGRHRQAHHTHTTTTGTGAQAGTTTAHTRAVHPPPPPPPPPPPRQRTAVGWQHGRQARHGRATDQGRPPGACHPVPAIPPGTRQHDRRVPCINIQNNGQAAQLDHRFGFWNATALLTARSSPFPTENHFKPAGTCQNAQRRRSVCIEEACRE